MSDSDTSYSASPPGRVRKQTIMSDNPPDIHDVIPDPDSDTTLFKKGQDDVNGVGDVADAQIDATNAQTCTKSEDNNTDTIKLHSDIPEPSEREDDSIEIVSFEDNGVVISRENPYAFDSKTEYSCDNSCNSDTPALGYGAGVTDVSEAVEEASENIYSDIRTEDIYHSEFKADTDYSADTNKLAVNHTGPKHEAGVGHKQPPSPTPAHLDIVYDETKPKRLSHPKTLKLDLDNHHNVRECISFLISPDEPADQRPVSPRRRGPIQSAFNFDRIETISDNGNCSAKGGANYMDIEETGAATGTHADHATVSMVKRTSQYQRSPESRRRKVSSPVQRMIVKNEQSGVTVAAKNQRRKSSSEAVLVSSTGVVDCNVPRRKISSDARLEHALIDQQMVASQADMSRKRKVSFDTTALFNGNKVIMPLNDQPRLSFQEEHEYVIEESLNDSGIEHDNGAKPKYATPPTILISSEDDEGFDQAEKDSTTERSNSDASEEGEEGYASGCDNKAFVPDEEDIRGPKRASSQANQQPRFYLGNPTPRVRRISPLASPSFDAANGGAAIIPHTATNVESGYPNFSNGKKLSSSSLPMSTGSGRRGSGEEVSTPKSILKNRQFDGESVASEDSIASKNFKLRKDSIALFMDSGSGNVAMQELRKEYGHKRWKCFGKADAKQMWTDRQLLLEKYKLHLLVLVLFLLTFSFVIVGLHFHSEHHKYVATAQKVFFDGKTRVLSLTDDVAVDTFTGTLGLDVPSWKHPTHCYANYAQIYDKTCLKWKEHGRLDIAYFTANNTKCYNVTWNMKAGTKPYDCYSLDGGYWYGPLNTTVSQWPIKSEGFTFSVNKAKHFGSGTFSTAVEYYWVSSVGHAVVIDSNYPLEISWNQKVQGSFCILGKNNGDFYHGYDPSLDTFHYTVCNGVNIQSTHQFIRRRYFPAISSIPERSYLEFPHWSTVWNADNYSLNQSVVEDVAEALQEHKLNCSSVEIDGKWENRYGDLSFNRNTFKNLSHLQDLIGQAGCQLSLNIYPFFSFNSTNFQEGLSKRFFVKDIGGTVPGLLRWQHGIGAMLDVTNPEARDWYTSKVRKVASEYSIKTFRLAYGTSSWIPHKPTFHLEGITPNKLKQMFSGMVSGLGNVVVQSTSQSQHISALLGITSSIMTVGDHKCLKNIIPDMLNLGLMGYPFVMSDGFSLDLKLEDGEHLPNRDVFIRWMQLSAFMPAMRYTIRPWRYDTEVIDASRNLTNFHSNFVVDAIFKMKDQLLAGEPLIKPMWWDQPNDHRTYQIDDQFMLADKYLVAPILCEVDIQRHIAIRDIYVPKGVWKDMISGTIILGPRLVTGYKASQFEIPYFEKMPQYQDIRDTTWK